MKRLILSLALLVCLPSLGLAQDLVSEFAGSELLGEFRTEFDRLVLARTSGDETEPFTVEGRMYSRFLRKPAEKSTLEVVRSYENELKQGGFEIVLSLSRGEGKVQRLIRDIYRDQNFMDKRPYQLGGKPSERSDWLSTFADGFLVAKKAIDNETAFVVLITGEKRNLYAIDVLFTDAMETGTVSLSLERLESGIASEGKLAIYDIHFDTNRAEIRPESEGALSTIAEFLASNPGFAFYVVGHTDDTGALDHNLRLSRDRADAVVSALATGHGIDATRMVAQGAGPLAPLSSNRSEDGRQQNRRVELVLRLSSATP